MSQPGWSTGTHTGNIDIGNIDTCNIDTGNLDTGYIDTGYTVLVVIMQCAWRIMQRKEKIQQKKQGL